MARRTSAGLLAYRACGANGTEPTRLEVFLAHMGGPFWARRDAGAWTIPKGEFGPEEEPLEAARREFAEEIGAALPPGPIIDLGDFRQPSGKVIRAFAVAAEELTFVASNHFQLEWPPGSGKLRSFPEVDRAQWLSLEQAGHKLVPGQVPILAELVARLDQLP